MQRVAALCKAQLASVAWGHNFNFVALNRDLRSLFLRVNRYQVDHNYRKLKHYLDADVHRVVLERDSHPGLPNLPHLVEDTDSGCFACHLVGFELYVDNEEGATLAKAANLAREEEEGEGAGGAGTDGGEDLDIPWLHYDDGNEEPETDLAVARAVDASGDMLHVFAEVRAAFTVRPMRDVDILEQTMMCVPIDDTGRAVSFYWTLRAYVGGIQDRHLAQLEEKSEDTLLDITTRPTALMPVGTERVLVGKPVWKIVDAYRL